MRRIHTRRELIKLGRELGVRPDWHEPDEQEVSAEFRGEEFDNAMSPGEVYGPDENRHMEKCVVLYQGYGDDYKPVAVVNLAMLFAWATGYEEKETASGEDMGG